ncbi:hypothetical protein PL81_08070 [Streptomyces sp. RSD-27]|nr:hypothetical protein PL81_08070 [Streptomyces sp. RSD-27]
MQRDRGQRRALRAVAADELGGEVLGLGGAAAVPGDEQPGTGGQPVGEQASPGAEAAGVEPGQCGDERLYVCAAR